MIKIISRNIVIKNKLQLTNSLSYFNFYNQIMSAFLPK